MKKKLLSLLLVMAVCIGTLAGCGSQQQTGNNPTDEASSADTAAEDTQSTEDADTSSENQAEATADEDVYTVSMCLLWNEQEEEEMIEAAMNEILVPAVGAKIDLVILPLGTYQQQLQLMLTGSEKLDLVPVERQNANSYVSSGQIINMTDLIDQYGDNIKAAVGEDLVRASSVGDFVYGTPIEREFYLDTVMMMRKDLVDKYNIDIDSIHSLADCEIAFKVIKENEPDMKVMMGSKDFGLFGNIHYGVDMMLDGYGVLENGGQSDSVKNLYETDQFVTLVETAYDFYQKGYIDQDILTSTDFPTAVVQSGKGFAYISSYKPSILAEQAKYCGYEMVAVPIQACDAFNSSDLVSYLSWGIAANSENPEKAMEVLNYLYSSTELINLMNWGIEGTHYQVIDEANGVIDFPEGIDATNVGYSLNIAWELPCKYSQYIWAGTSREDMDAEKQMNNEVLVSNAVGFMYNFSELSNEIAALNNVVSEYLPALAAGVANPDEVLPVFNEKLYAAGLQKVLDEKQRQYDEWKASR